MEESRTAPARATCTTPCSASTACWRCGPTCPVVRCCGYLRSFGDGEALDLVHLACLARGWARCHRRFAKRRRPTRILARLENHRSADGGYHAGPSAERGTLYGCFLGWGAYQDLGRELPDAVRLLNCIEQLQTADGGFSNQADLPIGLTAPTAAAVTLLRQLGQPARPALGQWLLAQQAPDGGFLAMPGAPLPDLLSTATALHALAGMQVDLQSVKTRVSILSTRSGPTAADSTATGATMN